jgi:hypothetical protein
MWAMLTIFRQSLSRIGGRQVARFPRNLLRSLEAQSLQAFAFEVRRGAAIDLRVLFLAIHVQVRSLHS